MLRILLLEYEGGEISPGAPELCPKILGALSLSNASGGGGSYTCPAGGGADGWLGCFSCFLFGGLVHEGHGWVQRGNGLLFLIYILGCP